MSRGLSTLLTRLRRILIIIKSKINVIRDKNYENSHLVLWTEASCKDSYMSNKGPLPRYAMQRSCQCRLCIQSRRLVCNKPLPSMRDALMSRFLVVSNVFTQTVMQMHCPTNERILGRWGVFPKSNLMQKTINNEDM